MTECLKIQNYFYKMKKVSIKYNEDNTDVYVYSHDDFISIQIGLSQTFYEIGLLSFLKEKYGKQKNILDIGANIGNHSLFFAKYFDFNHIYAFEPIYQNREMYKKNLADYKNKYTLFEYALSDKVGKKTLYNNGSVDNFGGFSLSKEEGSILVCDEIQVECLDNYNLTDITLMKIDVENHEREVLLGSKETILRNKPMIVLENNHYYFWNIFSNPNPHSDILTEWGYERVYKNVEQSSMDIWIAKS